MFGHQKKQENQSPIDYRKQEKHHKHMEQLAQLGAVTAGAYAMVQFT
jgi:ABA/WDS induced protein